MSQDMVEQHTKQGEIVMYQPDETIRLEVRLEDDTVWLTQAQMAELFQTTRNNVTLHIGNIFKEGELSEFSVRKESLLTAADGKKYHTKFYNLDVIISVGYRVKSAKREIILIDNYVDASIFDLLEKREQGVDATIYTEHVGQSLQHLQQLNQQQYRRRIEVKEYNNRFHDRFLILDDALYHFGASFKDLGKRLFAFELMGIDKSIILSQL